MDDGGVGVGSHLLAAAVAVVEEEELTQQQTTAPRGAATADWVPASVTMAYAPQHKLKLLVVKPKSVNKEGEAWEELDDAVGPCSTLVACPCCFGGVDESLTNRRAESCTRALVEKSHVVARFLSACRYREICGRKLRLSLRLL